MVVTMMMIELTWKPFTSWLWRTKWWKNLCTWSIIYTMWLSDVVERWWKHKIFPQKPASEVPHCFAMLLSNLVITILSGSKKKSVAKGAKIKMFTSSAIGRDGVWNTPRHISRRHSCGFFILIEVFSISHSFMFYLFSGVGKLDEGVECGGKAKDENLVGREFSEMSIFHYSSHQSVKA